MSGAHLYPPVSVYFSRQFQQSEKGEKGEVHILNEIIKLSTDYVKYFVFGVATPRRAIVGSVRKRRGRFYRN